MGKFHVNLQSQPEKYYNKVDKDTSKVLDGCFEALEVNPFFLSGRTKRLSGHEGLYRYQLGSLRVIYEVNKKTKQSML